MNRKQIEYFIIGFSIWILFPIFSWYDIMDSSMSAEKDEDKYEKDWEENEINEERKKLV